MSVAVASSCSLKLRDENDPVLPTRERQASIQPLCNRLRKTTIPRSAAEL